MPNLDFLIKGKLPKKQHKVAGVKTPIHSLLDGRYSTESESGVFIHKTHVSPGNPEGFHKGTAPFTVNSLIGVYSGLQSDLTGEIEQLLFIDTETTGLAGGTGSYAFLVGLGYFSDGEYLLEQYFITDPGGETELVDLLAEKISKFNTLVSFNGKSYDIPLLQTRFILHGSSFKIRQMPHIDLLPLARRFWKTVLPGCSLQQLEEYILGTGRQTGSDIPGSQIPQIYFEYLKTQDASPLEKVFYHNKIDILSMLLLLEKMGKILAAPLDQFDDHRASLRSVARLFMDLDKQDFAEDIYKFSIDQKIELSGCLMDLSMIYKRSGQMEEACMLWKTAAEMKEIYALVELAKAAEHKTRELSAALIFTNTAIDISSKRVIVDYQELAALHHRQKRLLRKLNAES